VRRTILVTGAAGFAARHLLDLLASDDVDLVAWRRPGVPGWSAHARPARSLAWHDVDVLDGAAVGAAIEAACPDEVYHLAGAAHVAHSWEHTAETLAINLLGTHHVLEALRRTAPHVRVLIPSSALVYRQSPDAIREDSPLGPASPYALSKLAQEMLGTRAWRDDGQPVIVARAFNHVGPGQSPDFFASSFARQVAAIEAGLAEPTLRVGNLDARRDLTDVRDMVRAYRALMAAGRPGRAYNVCTGRAHRVGDVLDGLVSRARVRVTVLVDPARLRPNDNPIVAGDFARLRQETGWTPVVPWSRTCDDLLDDWRQRLAAGGVP
jgi:GDP-4-dehydro-6-deoxy-D-mannose reductase